MSKNDSIPIDQTEYRVYFKAIKSKKLRVIGLKSKSFKGTLDYIASHRKDIEFAIKAKIGGAILICLEGGKK